MVDIKKIVKEIAEQNKKDSILQQIKEQEENNVGLKVGFIGEYSAGKTSLLNSILGTSLPEDISPTTKAICFIEPKNDLTNNKYFIEENGSRVEIDYITFEGIVCGREQNDSAILQIPATDKFPEGCIFVDTPGIHSAKEEEQELTTAYLSCMDGAILCVKYQQGCLTDDILKFLLSPALKQIHNRIIIALTFVNDESDFEQAQSVKSHIVETLQNLANEGKFNAKNIEDKIIFVGKASKENGEKVFGLLKKTILEQRNIIYTKKQNDIFKQLAKDLCLLLKEDYTCMQYDESKLKEMQNDIEEKIKDLDNKQYEKNKAKDKLEEELSEELKMIIKSNTNILSQEDETQIKIALETIVSEMTEACKDRINRYLKDFVFPSYLTGSFAEEALQKAKFIQKVGDNSTDIFTTILIAIATAGTGSAATTAGNAAEAAGGAAAATGANAIAKTAKNIERTAEVAQKIGKWEKFLGFVGKAAKAIKEILPPEQVKQMILPIIKRKALESFLLGHSRKIVNQVMQKIEQPYDEQVLKPLRNQLEEQKKELQKIEQARKTNWAAYEKQKKNLKNDIDTLKSLFTESK